MILLIPYYLCFRFHYSSYHCVSWNFDTQVKDEPTDEYQNGIVAIITKLVNISDADGDVGKYLHLSLVYYSGEFHNYKYLIFIFPILTNKALSIGGFIFQPAHRFCKRLWSRNIVFAIKASRLSCIFHYCHNYSSIAFINSSLVRGLRLSLPI